MQTHNHAMFTGISASLYTQLAGLQPAAPGITAVTIAPKVSPGLDWVRATVQTSRGPVCSAWQQVGTGLELSIAVPDDVQATVVVPLWKDYEVSATGAARVTTGEPDVVVEG